MNESLPDQCISVKKEPVETDEEKNNISSDVEGTDRETDEEITNVSSDVKGTDQEVDLLEKENGKDLIRMDLDENRSDNAIGVEDQENTVESGIKGLESTDPENFSNLHLSVSDIREHSFLAETETEPSSEETTETTSQPEFEIGNHKFLFN
jgi:hypothetical protein